MPAFIDLTGQKFNDLTVIERGPNKGKATRWYCRCVCGNTTLVAARNLKTGSVKTCGCKQYLVLSKKHIKNEVGNRFGRLVAIEMIKKPRTVKGKPDGNNVYFRCICDCGKETVVWGGHLRDGSTKSCGCLVVDTSREIHTTHGLSSTKEYIAAKTRRRKERMRKLDSQWTPEMEVFLRGLFQQCVLCGTLESEHQKQYGFSLHVDHVYPLSLGHGLEPGNATVLCISCNSSKQNKHPDDLPEPIRDRLIQSAELFKLLWDNRIHV